MQDDAEFPRPLSRREAATLDLMLSPDAARLIPLRHQAATAVVTGRCTCLCASINLSVDRGASSPATGLARQAVKAETINDTDPARIWWLFLWLDDGWLASLEIAYLDTVPTEFPAAGIFRAPVINGR